ncbi:hypothetical protein [Bosea eneae]|uniref:hypothetical protein n=1 Tax=Bosea eneae TaxID=151454 RepID=UPI003670F8D5
MSALSESGRAVGRIRDLFTEDWGGCFEDAVLLNRLFVGKLEDITAVLQATEGWKWIAVYAPSCSAWRWRAGPMSPALA